MTKESELHGRQSGSFVWKLEREETDEQVIYLFYFSIKFFGRMISYMGKEIFH
jgi:hypothetical protein